MRLGGLDSYEVERSQACARYGEKSANDEARVQKDMDLVVGSHVRALLLYGFLAFRFTFAQLRHYGQVRTQADVALMRRCYELSSGPFAKRCLPYDSTITAAALHGLHNKNRMSQKRTVTS